MKVFHRFLLFYLYSNLFIASCAILMAWQTYDVLLHQPPSIDVLGFIFFGTLVSYSFHWMLTSPENSPGSRNIWLRDHKWVHIVLFFVGVTGTTFFVGPLVEHWQVLLVTAFITFLYSAPKIPHPISDFLKKVALGKTLFLAMVWMHVTTTLPLLLAKGPWLPVYTMFAISRFLLIYAICILFDKRDRESDIIHGIRSLITWLSENSIRLLYYGSLILFFATTIALYWFDLSSLFIFILLIPGLILLFLYRIASQKGRDILYYFVLDGFMAISAAISLITGVNG